MRSGDVVGLVRKERFTILVLENKERETTVDVCGHPDILIGDYIWTQAGHAMWSSKGFADVKLSIHRLNWQDKEVCEPGIHNFENAANTYKG